MVKKYINDVHCHIKSRTKEEWVELALLKIERARLFIQENAELCFIMGLVLGIFSVLFFRLFFAVIFLAALAAGLVWCLAESELERRQTELTKAPPADPARIGDVIEPEDNENLH